MRWAQERAPRDPADHGPPLPAENKHRGIRVTGLTPTALLTVSTGRGRKCLLVELEFGATAILSALVHRNDCDTTRLVLVGEMPTHTRAIGLDRRIVELGRREPLVVVLVRAVDRYPIHVSTTSSPASGSSAGARAV